MNEKAPGQNDNCADDGRPVPDPLLGSTIDGKYEIVSCIGQGASSIVYEARDYLLGRKVAVKVLLQHLLSDSKAQERFMQESQTIASIDNPHIIKVFSRGKLASGQLYLIMDFIEGEELSAMLAREQTLDPASFFAIFDQILDGLAVAHAKGIIHRDIKPSNIMLSGTKDNLHAKILDFGVAKNLLQSNTAQTTVGALIGSSAYMSPEQCRGGAIDARSDLYSLGCVMYESLIGSAPFQGGSDMEVMYKQIHSTITHSNRLGKMPLSAREFLTRAMQKDPALRFQSANEMRQSLVQVKQTPQKAATKTKAVAIAALSLLVVLPAAFFLWPKQHSSDSSSAIDLDEQEIARLHDSESIDYFLNRNKAMPEARKLQICRIWLKRHPRSRPKDRANLEASQLRFADYLRMNFHGREAYDLYGSILQNQVLTKPRVEIIISRAEAAERDEAWSLALQGFQDALAANKSYDKKIATQCYTGISRAYFHLKQPELAEENARHAVSLCPKSVGNVYWNSVINLARILLSERQFKEVDGLCLSFFQTPQDSVAKGNEYEDIKIQYLSVSAESAARGKNFPKAEQLLKKTLQACLQAHKSDEQFRYQLADLYTLQGKYKEAVEQRQTIRDNYPPHAEFARNFGNNFLLALNYDSMGKTDRAIEQIESILSEWQKSGRPPMFFNQGGYALMTNLLQTLRWLLSKQGRLAEYEQLYVKGLSGSSGYERAAWLCDRGSFYRIKEQYAEAGNYYQQALSALPPEAEEWIVTSLRSAIADQLLAAGKNAEAEQVLKTLLESSKNDTAESKCAALRLQAQLAQAKGDNKRELLFREEAYNVARKIFTGKEPRLQMYSYELGLVYLKNNKANEGIAILLKAIDMAENDVPPNEINIAYYYAYCGGTYLQQGRYAEARHCLDSIADRTDRLLTMLNHNSEGSKSSQMDTTKSFLEQMQTVAEKHKDAAAEKKARELGMKLDTRLNSTKDNAAVSTK